jgi:hypothetical protein
MRAVGVAGGGPLAVVVAAGDVMDAGSAAGADVPGTDVAADGSDADGSADGSTVPAGIDGFAGTEAMGSEPLGAGDGIAAEPGGIGTDAGVAVGTDGLQAPRTTAAASVSTLGRRRGFGDRTLRSGSSRPGG